MKDKVENILMAINKRKEQENSNDKVRAKHTATEIWYMTKDLSKEERQYLRTLLASMEE